MLTLTILLQTEQVIVRQREDLLEQPTNIGNKLPFDTHTDPLDWIPGPIDVVSVGLL